MSLVAPAMPASARVDNGRESITQQSQVNSPLLRLPPEIRNHIYKHVFYDAHVKVNKAGTHPRRIQRYQPACSLLFTCRQTLHEARPLFHAAVIFEFGYRASPIASPRLYGVNEFFQLDLNTRKCVQNISIPKSGVEQIYEALFFHRAESYDFSDLIDRFREAFPALKHVYTNWNLDTNLLKALVRDLFDNDDIEVHVLRPQYGYLTGWGDDQVFD